MKNKQTNETKRRKPTRTNNRQHTHGQIGQPFIRQSRAPFATTLLVVVSRSTSLVANPLHEGRPSIGGSPTTADYQGYKRHQEPDTCVKQTPRHASNIDTLQVSSESDAGTSQPQGGGRGYAREANCKSSTRRHEPTKSCTRSKVLDHRDMQHPHITISSESDCGTSQPKRWRPGARRVRRNKLHTFEGARPCTKTSNIHPLQYQAPAVLENKLHTFEGARPCAKTSNIHPLQCQAPAAVLQAEETPGAGSSFACITTAPPPLCTLVSQNMNTPCPRPY